jgi:transposase-like protein
MRFGQPPADRSAPRPTPGPARGPGFRFDPRRAVFMEARTLDLIIWLRARRSRCADWPSPLSPSSPSTARTRKNPPCVRCQCARTHRWGSFRGRQRWRCLGCRRTFSDLTGTLFFRTWEPGAWLTFVEHLKETPTVRESARAVGINKDTALRWRHRLLDALGTAPGSRPRPRAGGESPGSGDSGQMEKSQDPVSTFLGVFHPLAFGHKTPERRGRGEGVGILLIRDLKTGDSAEWPAPPPLPTSVGSSHRGLVLQRVIHERTADRAARMISTTLAALQRDPARLIPHRRAQRILREAATSAGWDTPHPLAVWMEARQDIRGAGGTRAGSTGLVSAHEEQATARAGFRKMTRYIGQFKTWLRRFHGVADANLQRYLDWYLGILTPDPALREGVSRAQALLILASRQLSWTSTGRPDRSGRS